MAGDSSDDPRRGPGRPNREGERQRLPGGGGPPRGGPRRTEPGRRPAPRKTGGLGLIPIGGDRFELKHPSCVEETELDYGEGMEIWKEGDPDGARDALRYALQACRDNQWIHVALGRIAMESFRDPALARGHFGYAVELGQRALPPGFRGTLPADRRNNRPFYEAIEGLAGALEALGNGKDAAELRAMAGRLSGGPSRGGGEPSRRSDSGV
jgi:hypothetical protein